MTTTSTEPTTPSLRATSAEADAAISQLFGLDMGDVPDDGATEALGQPPAQDGTSVVSEPPPKVDEAQEPAADEEDPVRDLGELRKIATGLAAKRAQQGQDAVKVRELETRLQQIEQQRQQDAADAAALRKLRTMARDSPIDLLDTLGIDVVPFLQNGHHQALDREGHKRRVEAARLAEENARLAKRVDELGESVPKLLEQREEARALEARQQAFTQLTSDAAAYPLLSSEEPPDRLAFATRAVELLLDAGYTEQQITHKRVADTVEATLRKEFERRSAALGRVQAAGAAEDTAGDGGRVPAQGRVATPARRTPTTITQQMAAEVPNDREMTQSERERAANRQIAKMFGVPER